MIFFQVTNQHTFFVDDPKEVLDFDVATRLGTHPALMGRRTNRMKLETLKTATLPTMDKGMLQPKFMKSIFLFKTND